MAKIVVLGSKGQLGSDLIKVFTHSEHKVVSSASNELNAAHPNVKDQLAKYADADYIINCIAATNVDGCEGNPELAFQINSAFVVDLAQFCTANDIVLFYISSDYVFDGNKNQPYVEDDLPNPLNVYGLSKYAGELAVKNYAAKYFTFRVSSLFGVAGASGKGGNFITTMLRLAAQKDSWTVIEDQWTCPTHTLDIARAIKTFIDKGYSEYGIYHCVSNDSCSWLEFAREVLFQAGYDKNKVQPISYKEYSFNAKRPQYGIMSTAKLAHVCLMPGYKAALIEYLALKNDE